MPYRPHKLFEHPPPSTAIYRYMTLGKWLATAQTGRLWFTHPRLTDKHEGRLGAGDKDRQEYLAAYGEDFCSMFYVSCWSEGPHESNAMWSLYAGAGEGVCIRSTVGRLIDAVASEPGDVHLGRVQYVDHGTLTKPIQDGNVLSPWLYKRAILAAERELRAGVLRPNGDGVAFPVHVDLAQLIEAIIVHPGAQPWFLSAVERSARSANIDAPVVHSVIDEVPPKLRTLAEMESALGWKSNQREVGGSIVGGAATV